MTMPWRDMVTAMALIPSGNDNSVDFGAVQPIRGQWPAVTGSAAGAVRPMATAES